MDVFKSVEFGLQLKSMRVQNTMLPWAEQEPVTGCIDGSQLGAFFLMSSQLFTICSDFCFVRCEGCNG